MRRTMVRYKVKAGRAQENQRLIEAVFAELESERPSGIRYASFRLADGVSFLHLASVETANGSNPLLACGAFERFTAAIGERCLEPPATFELEEVGSYRMLTG